MLNSKKILILYTSVGLGHKSIAENIGFYLVQAGYEVKIADIGKVQKGKFEKIVVSLHQFINRRLPFVWGWLYDWGHYLTYPVRVIIAGFNYQLTKNFVDEFQPELIITSQTAASAVVAYLKKTGFYKNSFGIAFSDYHLHPYWLYKQADFYLANIKEQKDTMIERGILAERIFVCGMLLKPKIDVNAPAVKLNLGIGAAEKVVLIGSGSLGIGLDEKFVEKFVNGLKAKIIVVCGKNEEAYKKLERRYQRQKSEEKEMVHSLCPSAALPPSPRLRRASAASPPKGEKGEPLDSKPIILGYYSPMDELYAIADIFVTKPGGLSVAEALRWDLPILISHTLPGQEHYNLQYLLQQSWVMPKASNLVGEAQQELQTGEFKKNLQKKSRLPELFNGAGNMLEAVKNFL